MNALARYYKVKLFQHREDIVVAVVVVDCY